MSKWIAEFELEDGDTMPEHMDLNYMGGKIDFYCRPLDQEQKTKWISVKDNMPVVGEEVLACDLDGDVYITYLHTDGKWGFDYNGNKIKNIIAWQPLPEPYKESEE